MHTAIQAQQRVQNTPELAPYYDIICEYDWDEGQEHIDWVCTATVPDIVEWAAGIRALEDEAEHGED